MRLTPARRAIYGVALLSAAFGVVSLFRGISVFGVPVVDPAVLLPHRRANAGLPGGH